MALTNVRSEGGSLISLSSSASAVSTTFTQQISETDYRRVKEVRTHFELSNISAPGSPVDTLWVKDELTIGDKIIIKTADGSFNDFTIPSGGTPIINGPIITPMTSNTLPIGRASTYYLNVNDYHIADNSYSSSTYVGGTNGWMSYEMPGLTPIEVKTFYLKATSTYLYNFDFQTSIDGINWVTQESWTSQQTPTNVGTWYTLATPVTSAFFRIFITYASSSVYIQIFQLGGAGFSYDVSSITAGEVPSSVYKAQTAINLNNDITNEDTTRRYLEYLTSGFLKTISIYPEIILTPARTIEMTINFAQVGTTIREITGQIFKLGLKQGSATHTSNILPINNVSVGGVNATLSTDAFKVFDGDLVNNAFSASTGALGVTDIYHDYTFDSPTTCYALKMKTGIATEAPAVYEVLGSLDGINFVSLLTVSQSIAIDNLELTKSFDINLYDAYSVYRIHITKGNTENSVVSAIEYTLLDEDLSTY